MKLISAGLAVVFAAAYAGLVGCAAGGGGGGYYANDSSVPIQRRGMLMGAVAQRAAPPAPPAPAYSNQSWSNNARQQTRDESQDQDETQNARKPRRQADEDAPAPRVAASDVDKIGKFTEKEHVDDFALVVGIEKYQNVPKADYAEHDAQTMKKYFEAMGVPEENVILLTGDKATRTGLAKYLEEWLPKNVTADSRVYFYYSGHGAPDPADSTAYLVPWDGDASYLKTSAYPVSRLYEKLAALKAKQVIVMLDSCFSGAGGRSVIAKGARPLVNVVNTAVPEDSHLTVLAASSGDQISGTIDEQGHGMFTYFVLKGLKGEADPEDTGHVSLDALYTYVKKSVSRAAHRDNRDQTPELHSANPALKLY